MSVGHILNSRCYKGLYITDRTFNSWTAAAQNITAFFCSWVSDQTRRLQLPCENTAVLYWLKMLFQHARLHVKVIKETMKKKKKKDMCTIFPKSAVTCLVSEVCSFLFQCCSGDTSWIYSSHNSYTTNNSCSSILKPNQSILSGYQTKRRDLVQHLDAELDFGVK